MTMLEYLIVVSLAGILVWLSWFGDAYGIPWRHWPRRLLLDMRTRWDELTGTTAVVEALESVACPGRRCADHSPTERTTAP